MLEAFQNLDQRTANTIFYGAAALVASRKFCMSGVYKVGGKIAELIGNEYMTDELTHAGEEYFRLAKKNIFRDLTSTAKIMALFLLAKEFKEQIKLEVQPNKSWIYKIIDPKAWDLCHCYHMCLTLALGIFAMKQQNLLNNLVNDYNSLRNDVRNLARTQNIEIQNLNVVFVMPAWTDFFSGLLNFLNSPSLLPPNQT